MQVKYTVLGIGYAPQEYNAERSEWLKYGIGFDFADTIPQAIEKLRQSEYVCIAIRVDHISAEELHALREVRTIPSLILPTSYTVDERFACVHLSAIQYAREIGRWKVAEAGGKDSLQLYLDMPTAERKPLTIITVKDLSFCLEHRSVEVRGQSVKLTEKEFDILALLIMNQRQVFTPDMIMDSVWREDFDFYSKTAVSTHVSNLRRKLKIMPDVPDYISTVHRVGYKFEV